ncbi:AraC family transcriptional regulator [Sediminivirga luteola]|uniref:AraC family transcriptional regulator n=1 Tax=Sediminivirga luteola TaxID=1774748 RepID=A0A8J2U1D8_9MICO|nr:AraC family transcriptional regulator [Sediminivirga luteola]GGA28742.1 AraC family transcriptional regulator [Sediminivirga luteola]
MDLDAVRTLIARHAHGGERWISETAVISSIERGGVAEFSTTGTMLVLLVQGAKQMTVGEELHTYRAGQTLLTSVDLPTVGHFVGASRQTPALGFALMLRPALIADLLLTPAAGAAAGGPAGGSAVTAGRAGSRGDGTVRGLMIDDAAADLVEAVGRMVRLLERPADLGVLAPLVEREIVWLLLRGPRGEAVRQLGLADSTLSRVREVVGWLGERYAETVRVAELARMARMSPSAFHRSFHAVTGMSPIQFQKQLRLQEARLRLTSGSGHIAAVAHAVGYESPSQFSRDYRRRFGVSPREDAAGVG